MENQDNQTKPNTIDILLDIWVQSHLPKPTLTRSEKNFSSINEVMAFLNNSASRVEPERMFDADYVIDKLQGSDFQTQELGGTLHIIYY
jgi:hypothetical protein